jgi:hydrogenase nickel incorporation protein HypA/HybF
MHELSLVAGLFEILEEKARDEKALRVTAVTLRVGRLSGVVPELLETAFDTFKKGTIASRAKLRIEIVPLKVKCRSCGKESLTDEPLFVCSSCASPGLEIMEGQELTLQRMEIEKDD